MISIVLEGGALLPPRLSAVFPLANWLETVSNDFHYCWCLLFLGRHGWRTGNSLDVRRGRSGRHWWNEQRFGRRVRFLLPLSTGGASSGASSKTTTSTASLARLQIVNVTRQDGGDYRCRVDFNDAPSRNFKYRLIVIGQSSLVHLSNQRQSVD